jgi:hypothetical protein
MLMLGNVVVSRAKELDVLSRVHSEQFIVTWIVKVLRAFCEQQFC